MQRENGEKMGVIGTDPKIEKDPFLPTFTFPLYISQRLRFKDQNPSSLDGDTWQLGVEEGGTFLSQQGPTRGSCPHVT